MGGISTSVGILRDGPAWFRKAIALRAGLLKVNSSRSPWLILPMLVPVSSPGPCHRPPPIGLPLRNMTQLSPKRPCCRSLRRWTTILELLCQSRQFLRVCAIVNALLGGVVKPTCEPPSKEFRKTSCEHDHGREDDKCRECCQHPCHERPLITCCFLDALNGLLCCLLDCWRCSQIHGRLLNCWVVGSSRCQHAPCANAPRSRCQGHRCRIR